MSKITPSQRKKLKEFLGIISSPEEASKMETEETDSEIRQVHGKIDKIESGTLSAVTSNIERIDKKLSGIRNTDLSPLIEILKETNEHIKRQKPQDMSGFFKDIGMSIAGMGKYTKSTAEIIQTLKWNSTMGIKNRDGSPISPSVSPFQISDYDRVNLSGYDANGNPSTVTYHLGGSTVGIVTLTYDGSGNLTQAARN